jgi:hypothetical protein
MAAASTAAAGAARGLPQVQSAWDLGSPLLLTPTAAMATATPTNGGYDSYAYDGGCHMVRRWTPVGASPSPSVQLTVRLMVKR